MESVHQTALHRVAPHLRYASSVARLMSSTAPVLTEVQVSSSAARPPISMAWEEGDESRMG
jgi:hypothetical protein